MISTKPSTVIRPAIALLFLAGLFPAASRVATAQSWSPPLVVSQSIPAQQSSSSPRLATDGSGNWACTWLVEGTETTTSGLEKWTREIVAAISNGSDSAWASPVTLSEPGELCSQPAVSAGGSGNWGVAWSSGDVFTGYALGLAESSDWGNSWTTASPAGLNAADHIGFFTPALLRSGGDWNIGYSESDTESTSGFAVTLCRSSSPLSPNRTVMMTLDHLPYVDEEHFSPQLASDGNGRWIAAWQVLSRSSTLTARLLYSRSQDGGNSWSPPVELTGASLPSDRHASVHLATNGAGTWIVTWSQLVFSTISTTTNIFRSRSTDNGVTWSAPADIDPTPSADSFELEKHPRIAASANGKWLAIWGARTTTAAVSGNDSDLLYSVSEDDGNSWSEPAYVLSGFSMDTAGDTLPDLAASPDGTFVAVWQSVDPLSGTGSGDPQIISATLALQAAAAIDWALYL